MSELDPKAKRKRDLRTHGPELDEATAATIRTAVEGTLSTYGVFHRTQVQALDSLKTTLGPYLQDQELASAVAEEIGQAWKPIWTTQMEFIDDALEAKADRTDLDRVVGRIPGAFQTMSQREIIHQLDRQEKRIDRLEEVLLTQKGITLAGWQLWLAVILFVASVILNVWQALW